MNVTLWQHAPTWTVRAAGSRPAERWMLCSSRRPRREARTACAYRIRSLRIHRTAAEGDDQAAVRGEGPAEGAGERRAAGSVGAGPELVGAVGVADDLVVRP